jgi:hypothetical protein
MTSPEVERAVLRAYPERKWAEGRSNPGTDRRLVLLVFGQALCRLSYQPNEKSPMSLLTPGFCGAWVGCGQVSQALEVPGHTVRRVIGESPRPFLFAGDT